MLSRVESKIMDYLFERCVGKKTVLIAPSEILQGILPKHEITAKQLEAYIKNIALDGYIDVYNSDNKGSLVYVVTLKRKGEAFRRDKHDRVQRRWRAVGWKVALTVLGSALALILGRILWPYIFGG